jgi:hypothetical protein
MARDGLAPKTGDKAGRRPADPGPAPAFGPLQGGSIIHWTVQERRG